MQTKFLTELKTNQFNRESYDQDDLTGLIDWATSYGYIQGVTYRKTLGGKARFNLSNPRLTLNGKEFLDETFDLNSLKTKFLTELKTNQFNEESYDQDDLTDLIDWATSYRDKFIHGISYQKTLDGIAHFNLSNPRLTLNGKEFLDETFDLNSLKTKFLTELKTNQFNGESYNQNDLIDLIDWATSYGYVQGITYRSTMGGLVRFSVSRASLTLSGDRFLN